MAVEEQRLRIRQSPEEKLGVEEASYLMDRPPGGWSDLVTNQTLGLRFEVFEQRFDAFEQRINALEERMDARFAAFRHEVLAEIERRFRMQTWALVSAVFAGVTVLGALERI
jgi:hypothetical protein